MMKNADKIRLLETPGTMEAIITHRHYKGDPKPKKVYVTIIGVPYEHKPNVLYHDVMNTFRNKKQKFNASLLCNNKGCVCGLEIWEEGPVSYLRQNIKLADIKIVSHHQIINPN